MKVSGYKVSGYNFLGKLTLNSIGQLAYLFDYRFGVTLESGRVAAWNDLSTNGVNLLQPGLSRRLYSYSDGIGDYETTSAVIQALGNFAPSINIMHNGTPFIQWCVIKLNNTVSRLNIPNTANAPANGSILQILETTRRFRSQVNDGTSNIVDNTTAGSLTEDVWLFVMKTYYGSGTGSNNTKLYRDNSVELFTNNPTFTSANASRFVVGKGTGAGNFKIKSMGAYNLSGKSSAQIDAFQALFISTLKSDPEYSGLTTP